MTIIYDAKLNKDGTILLPAELIKSLGLKSGDRITVYLDEYQSKKLEPEFMEALVHEGIIMDFQY
jgi:bifunctional DNA-binding transcriptional regulator/antitoxin component of YhaV-PrlF toxin-antitoxin module